MNLIQIKYETMTYCALHRFLVQLGLMILESSVFSPSSRLYLLQCQALQLPTLMDLAHCRDCLQVLDQVPCVGSARDRTQPSLCPRVWTEHHKCGGGGLSRGGERAQVGHRRRIHHRSSWQHRQQSAGQARQLP